MRTPLKRFVMIAVTLVVVGTVVYQLLPPSEAGRAAVSRLAKVQTFSFGGVGYAGSIPERENWFFTILSSRHADRLFRELFEQGTVEARPYALAGLYYRELIKRMADEIIEHREDFESPGFGSQADEIIEKYAVQLHRLCPVFSNLNQFAFHEKPKGTEPRGKDEFRCFGCGGVIRREDERCRICGWSWK